ncbi:asparaginase domain-containing protein [Brevibacterium samyangense]|uniref:Asparaginase n=1 Tax=Brevibacterium samyangense TaxID=366888 RepID=A0ABP5ENB0_9MICO
MTASLHVIALGGTIASTASQSGGVAPQVGAEAIAAAAHLESLPDGAPHVEFTQLAQVSSGSITLGILCDVVHEARRAASRRAHGIVLTQGTDTLEDSAFVLSLLNDSGIPIVLTGAMRNPTLPGADGPANVRTAAIAALDPRLRALPAVVAFNDEIHDPSTVTKAHASSVAAFTSGPAAGPLGWVSEDRLLLPHVPAAVPGGFALPREAQGTTNPEAPRTSAEHPAFAKVALVEAGLDDSLDLITALPDLGYAGAVVSGVGGGHVPEWVIDRVADLAHHMPVVLASRTGSGTTLEHTYGYRGGEIELIGHGLTPSGRLHARKARLLLTLALTFGTPVDEVFRFYR